MPTVQMELVEQIINVGTELAGADTADSVHMPTLDSRTRPRGRLAAGLGVKKFANEFGFLSQQSSRHFAGRA